MVRTHSTRPSGMADGKQWLARLLARSEEVLGDVMLSLNDGWLARRLRRSPQLYQQFRASGMSLREFKQSSAGRSLLEEELDRLCALCTSISSTTATTLARNVSERMSSQPSAPQLVSKGEGAEMLAELLCSIGMLHMQLSGPSSGLPFTSAAALVDSSNSELQWIHKHVQRFARIETEQAALRSQPALPRRTCPPYAAVPVEDASSLTVERFRHEYANRRRPVVIRGLSAAVLEGAWTQEWVRTMVGHRKVTLRKENRKSLQWARLDAAETTTISDFLDKRHAAYKKHYVFDQSLQLHLPELMAHFHIPKYFEHEFLHQLEPNSKYARSWPSLFIGNAGVVSDLHVDAFASNFWMFLVSGVKRWIFFPPGDTPKLNPDLTEAGQLSFKVHPFDHSPGEACPHDLYACTQPLMCDLQAGELLFVPSGSPHAVQNITDSIAVSGNFVDDSNIDAVLEALRVDRLVDPGAEGVLRQLSRRKETAVTKELAASAATTTATPAEEAAATTATAGEVATHETQELLPEKRAKQEE
ncbi:hypothetical protein PTSG_07831 [Salpingoeca rosetta]|uniref:JmjC domain-containing protein n=1 Tax=Salpingoeca rosetta (strain ATCC 50818 / BSB-021) TaxID=946362 RepID=F2UGG4_SALR5|nr:uncharacterized protein PTSG_07831 [Salpingoeca rosetta]EGD75714.1 hypothetical protein PTSG_07831 [Salpingoeca rosetta]|eukprot:XP_004991635.1 hypothetical protein PTSG_07831 [Salpingoeca rosetta]